MKRVQHITRLMAFALILVAPLLLSAQSKFHGQDLIISVTGTSSLHDWEMKSRKAISEALITINKDMVTIASLSFTMPVETLKSGHNTMDKNTYKAIDSKKNPNIMFVLASVTSITPTGAHTYLFKGTGKLTIAGTTKLTDIQATLKYNPADKSFTCTGSKKIKMTEYGVKPPVAMLGTIKTGNEVSINYNINLK
ncbi:MAG TPA: YceI family protein, partial [Flavisolibacter sp.]|nr:YceI family protein [Flavisolibacter sp.]